MKQLLQDTMTIRLTMTESEAGGKMVARGEFARADVPTANRRVYGRKLWERELRKLQTPITERKVFGELDHPADGKTKLSRAALLITSLELGDDGVVIGAFEVMDTAAGRDLKAILDAGGSVGVSSRGYGSVKMNEDGNDVVQDDYTLMTFDVVADPAQHTAYPEFSVESKTVTNSVAETKAPAAKQLLTSDGAAPVQVKIEADEQPAATPAEDEVPAPVATPEVTDKEHPTVAAAPQDGPNAAEAPGEHQKPFAADAATADPATTGGDVDAGQPVVDPGSESGEPKADPAVDGEVKDESDESVGSVIEAGRFGIHLIKNPTGTFSFTGSIPVQLYWTKKDGSELSDEEAEEVANASNPAMLAKSRSFKTVADALKKAAEFDVKKSDVQVHESVDVMTKDQHEAIVSDLTTKFEGQLAVAMKEATVKIEEKVVSEMMADPEVAGSKLALETVKRILRPYIMPSDISEAVELKEAEVRSLRAQVESKDREIRNLTSAVKDLGFNLYLAKRLGAHPKFDKIVEGLGDLTAIDSLDTLKARVKLFEDELPGVLAAAKEERVRVVTKLKERVAQLESKLVEESEQRKQISEERDEAIATGLESAARAYLERKLVGLENAPQVRKAFENIKDKTKVGIDSLVESFQLKQSNAARDFTRIRDRLGGRVRSTTLVEDALAGTKIEDSKVHDDAFRVTDDFSVPLKQMERLAGLPQG